MTVEAFMKESGFKAICLPSPQKEIDGAYVGDLLSWVMGNANSGNLWITIMSNINIVAVAALADTACIILAEGVSVDEQVITVAKEKGINILCSDNPAYEIATALSKVL